MANFDGNVSVVVSLTAALITTAGFGTPLFAGASMGAGFTERIRRYTSPSAAENDADLSAALRDRVLSAFSQKLKPATVAVGRIDALAVESANVALTAIGANADTHLVTVLGQQFTHVSDGAETLAAQVDALIILITAAALPVALVDNGDDFDIVGTNAGQPLGVAYSQTGTCAGAATLPTPAVTYATGLSAIEAVDGDWYGLALESRKAWDIESAAGWVEPREKLLVAQTRDADVLTAVSTDIASVLEALSYSKVATIWHDDDLEFADCALLSNRLAVNPDQKTTTWAYVTLVGVTPQNDNINDTQKANLESKNVNMYLTIKSVGATGEGKVAVGEWIDVVTSAAWFKARVAERAVTVLLEYSNRGDKVPYDNDGIDVFAGVVEGVQEDGERVGHFLKGASVTDAPTIDEVSSADRQARRLFIEYSMEPAGAIHLVTYTGTLAIATA